MDLFTGPATFSDLPDEVLIQAIYRLPIESILQNCVVDQRSARICNKPLLWQALLRRDYPWVSVANVADPRSLYMKIRDDLFRLGKRAREAGQRGSYWIINKPGRLLSLVGAQRYVQMYPDAQGYDRFVYWPDYRVAGTVNNIIKTFRELGAHVVDVGALYQATQGQVGSEPGTYPITEQLIYQNALDPLDPNQHQLILSMSQPDQAAAQLAAPQIAAARSTQRQAQTAYRGEALRLGQIEGASNIYNGFIPGYYGPINSQYYM